MFLGCINKATPSSDAAVISPLYWALVGLPLEFCVLCSLLVPSMENRTGWWGSRAGHKRGQRTGKTVIWGKAERTVQPWEKKVMGRPYVQTMFQYLKDGYKGGDLLFTKCHIEKTRDKGCKLLLGRFSLDIRGKFFTMRTIIHWNKPPTEVVYSQKLTLLRLNWTGC